MCPEMFKDLCTLFNFIVMTTLWEELLLLFLFTKEGNRSSERLSHMLKATKPVSVTVMTQTQGCLQSLKPTEGLLLWCRDSESMSIQIPNPMVVQFFVFCCL